VSTTGGCAGTFDPAKVYLRGTTAEGSAEAESWVTDMSTGGSCAGLYSATFPTIRSDGRIIYGTMVSSTRVLYAYTPDPLEQDQDGRWHLPSDALRNDTLLPTPGCDAPALPRAWPDTTGHAANCGSYGGPLWGSDGKLVGKQGDAGAAPGEDVVALGYTGHLLRKRFGGLGLYELYIEDSEGAETFFASAGLPANGGAPYRARKDGFWFVARDSTSSQDPALTLWHLGFDGTAKKIGDYAAPPTGTKGSGTVLDGDGALYGFGSIDGVAFGDIVVRRPLLPGMSSIAWDETKAPKDANDFSGPGAPVIYPKIHISDLITGP
jgi:hypothetical protein